MEDIDDVSGSPTNGGNLAGKVVVVAAGEAHTLALTGRRDYIIEASIIKFHEF